MKDDSYAKKMVLIIPSMNPLKKFKTTKSIRIDDREFVEDGKSTTSRLEDNLCYGRKEFVEDAFIEEDK